MEPTSIDKIHEDLLNYDVCTLLTRDNNYLPVGRFVELVPCTVGEDYVANYNFVQNDSKHKWKGNWENKENKHAMYRPDEFIQAMSILGNTDAVLEFFENVGPMSP